MAAATIAQRIALEGAREIAKELAELGITGERALRQIAGAAQEATLPMTAFERRVADMRQALSSAAANARAAAGEIGTQLGNIAAAVGDTAKRFGVLAGAVAAAATGFALFVRSGVRAANEIEDTAASLGLSTDSYQRLQFAAAAASIEQDKFANGMKFLAKNVADAAQASAEALVQWRERLGVVSVGAIDAFNKIGAGADLLRDRLIRMGVRVATEAPFEGAFDRQLTALGVRFVELSRNVQTADNKLSEVGRAFDRLGVSVVDASGAMRPLEDIVGDLADRFARLGRGPEATALALQIFGRQGHAMLPLLLRGRNGVRELAEAFTALGLALTEQDVRASEEAIGAFTRLSNIVENLKIKLASIFAPQLATLVNAITGALARNQAALRAWAQQIAERARPVIDDFVAVLSGRAPTAGGLVDSIVQSLTGFAARVRELIQGAVIPAFETLMGLLDRLARAVNAVFGTNLTGRDVAIIAVVGQITGAFSLLLTTTTALAAIFVALGTAIGALGLPALAAAAVLAEGALQRLAQGFGLSEAAAKSLVLALKAAAIAGLVFAGPAGWIAAVILAAPQVVGAIQDMIDALTRFQAAARGRAEAVRQLNQADRELLRLGEGEIARREDAGPLLERRRQLLAQLEQAGRESADRRVEAEQAAAQRIEQLQRNAADSIGKAASEAAKQVEGALSGADRQVGQLKSAFDDLARSIRTVGQEAQRSSIAVRGVSETPLTPGAPTSGAKPPGVIDLKPVEDAAAALRAILDQLMAAAGERAQGMVNAITNAVSALPAAVDAALAGLADIIAAPFQQAADRIEQILAPVAQRVRDILADIDRVGSGNFGAIGSPFAFGGLVRGPGTATSDSIPAWLSRGEFVVRAAAVEHYGAALFAALNALRLPRFGFGGLIEEIKRLPPLSFADGGLVPAAVAARPVTLIINGERVNGLTANEDALDSLQRIAALKRVRLAGRRQSAYR
jgi:hypothetical protein